MNFRSSCHIKKNTKPLKFTYSQSAFKAGAGFKAEDTIQFELPDQTIYRRLTMFALHFRQDQLSRIPIVKPAEISLNPK